jgi:uncharacterized protein YkwD
MRSTVAAILVFSALLSGLPALSFSRTQIAAAQTQATSDPEIAQSINVINTYRKWLGIPALTVDPHLQRAAEAHVDYYRQNFGDPELAGMGLHYETVGKPGFTGESFQERAEAAGYKGWVNENAGLSGSMLWSLDWFIATVGHRLTLIDPRYQHIGMAAVDDGDMRFEIIDLGTNAWVEDTIPEWSAWPPNDTTGVGLSFDGEAPDPFPAAQYPVGYPVSLKYFGTGDLTFTRATISTGGTQLPSFAEVGTGWLSRDTILLCTEEPLQPATRYDVLIEGHANGEPFSTGWHFTTTSGDDRLALYGETGLVPIDDFPPGPLPKGVAGADELIQQLWWETDGAVAEHDVERSWLWGPDTWSARQEESREAASGTRQVYYFDKARMEVNDGDGEQWITAGLLVRDMIAGKVQVGEDEFVRSAPANVPLTGDPQQFNPDAPTYASLNGLASIEAGREVSQRTGEPITDVLASDGSVSTKGTLGGYARYAGFDTILGHNIANVFVDYFGTLPTDWQMSVGLPLAEPYWVRTNLAGQPAWVLVQAFERRILTYTPTNRPEWRVEMGNVGRHYFTWRYNEEPPQ